MMLWDEIHHEILRHTERTQSLGVEYRHQLLLINSFFWGDEYQ